MEDYKKMSNEKRETAKKVMKPKEFKKCNWVIHTAALASAAGGVIPVPVMDAVPITAVQVTMVVSLGKIFDQSITNTAAKSLLGPATATLAGRSLAKLIPGVGWAVSASVAASVTEAIGWMIAADFATDARKNEEINNMRSNHSGEDAPPEG